MSEKAALYLAGGGLELVGITLVAAPDLVPGARRLSAWLLPKYRRAARAMRKLLHFKTSTTVHAAAGTATMTLGGRVSAVKSVSATATLSEKVDFLLQRDQEAQRDVNEVRHQLTDAQENARQGLADLEQRMKEYVTAEVQRASDEYRAVRTLGAVILIVGVVISTWANLL